MASSTAATALTAGEDNVNTLLAELETQKTLITDCSLLYSHLLDHFTSLNQALASKSETLDSDLEALDLSTSETLASLSSRAADIPSHESSAAASIAATRDAVVARIETEASDPSNPRNVLTCICLRMDGAQLWRHVAAGAARADAVREAVFKEAIDPCRLVVDAVGDFVGDDSDNNDKCWVMGILVKCLFDSDGKKKAEVGESLVERAAVVAAMWKERFFGRMEVEEMKNIEQQQEDEVKEEKKQEEEEEEEVKEENKQEQEGGEEKDGEGGNVSRNGGERVVEVEKKGGEGKKGDKKEGSTEAEVFLRLVAAFGLERRFEREFLRNVFVKYVRSKELARLAPMLGLEDSLRDIIEELIKSKNEVEAVYVAHESGLIEQFPPAPLLKSFHQAFKEESSATMKKGKRSSSAMEELNRLELRTLKSIIQCVETCKLESEFSTEGLKKRIAKIERDKADRKKFGGANKLQNKRARSATGASPHPAKAGRGSSSSKYTPHHRNPSAKPHAAASRHSYNYAAPGGFNTPAAPPVAAVQQYYVPEDASGRRNVVSYGGPGANYGSYDYAAAQSAAPQQQYTL